MLVWGGGGGVVFVVDHREGNGPRRVSSPLWQPSAPQRWGTPVSEERWSWVRVIHSNSWVVGLVVATIVG